jgi:hypothetical protein
MFSAKQKYRKYATALLLLLYAFVTTPVQLWHHHNVTAKLSATQSAANNKTKKFTAAASNPDTDNCVVCAHNYTTYCNDASPALEIFICLPKADGCIFIVHTPTAPCFNYSNKGPPTTV